MATRSCCSTPRTAVAGARSATSAQAPCRSTRRSSASATIHISWNCARPTVEPLQRIDAKQECRSLETTEFFSSAPQQFADERARFHYGSLGGELVAGIPYPIFMILPRVFPDLVERYATEGYGPEKPGYGGYGAFGLAWE